MIKKIKLVFYYLFILPYYKIKFGKYGNNSHIVKPTSIDNYKNIFIGQTVLISHGGWLAANPITGNQNCKLIIGDGTYVGRFCHIYATSKIEIGKKVLIADKVYISDNLHGYKDISIPVIYQPIVQVKEVLIDEGSWLGENVCVIGASIGKHCVIGANSVVTKDIPDYCIAVGSPAKIIKRYSFEKKQWIKTDSLGKLME